MGLGNSGAAMNYQGPPGTAGVMQPPPLNNTGFNPNVYAPMPVTAPPGVNLSGGQSPQMNPPTDPLANSFAFLPPGPMRNNAMAQGYWGSNPNGPGGTTPQSGYGMGSIGPTNSAAGVGNMYTLPPY